MGRRGRAHPLLAAQKERKKGGKKERKRGEEKEKGKGNEKKVRGNIGKQTIFHVTRSILNFRSRFALALPA